MLRRSFDDQFKEDRVREYVTGAKKVGEILEENGIVSSVFARWRAKFEAKIRKEVKNAAKAQGASTAVVVADPSPPSGNTVSAGEVVKRTFLTAEQRDELYKRLQLNEKPAHIARAMNIHPPQVGYYKKKLKSSAPPQVVPSKIAPEPVLTPQTRLANDMKDLVMARYNSGVISDLGPLESLILVNWHMAHGRL